MIFMKPWKTGKSNTNKVKLYCGLKIKTVVVKRPKEWRKEGAS